MQLCLECGRVEDHNLECKRRPPAPENAAEKQARVQKAMVVAQAVLDRHDDVAKESNKLAILKLLAADALLERWPSRDLTAFDTKRAHNDLVSALAKKRIALEESSGAGRQFTEDARFAKAAVELAFAQALRREESKRVDLAALGELPVSPISGLDRPLKVISNEIDARLEMSRDLGARVTEWGWKNLGRLMLGLDPFEVPRSMIGTGMLSKLGVGTGDRVAEIKATFKPLGDKFRERLYLIGASSALLPIISRQAQAEEAWRKHLAKNDGAARWERIKQGEKELADYYVGEDPTLPGAIEEVIQKRAVASPALSVLGLRPAREVRGVEWEGWAKGYFLELDAINAGSAETHMFGTRKLAKLLIERKPGVDVPRERVAETLALLQAAWREKPPSGTP